MTDKQTKTRTRSRRRRENNKVIYGIIAFLVIVLLILLVIFFQSNKDQQDVHQDMQGNENNLVADDGNSSDNENDTETGMTNDGGNNDSNDENAIDEEDDDIETSSPLDHVLLSDFGQSEHIQVTNSDDKDVIESYVANWQAIGTSQSGEHHSNFSDGSADRIEINQAITKVTKLNEDEFTLWWVGNDGFNKAFTDIEEKATGQLYRLFLTWNDGSGWQVTQVDKLARSEHKEEFTNNESEEAEETNNGE